MFFMQREMESSREGLNEEKKLSYWHFRKISSTVWIKKVEVEARLEAMRPTNKLLQLYKQEMMKVVVE